MVEKKITLNKWKKSHQLKEENQPQKKKKKSNQLKKEKKV